MFARKEFSAGRSSPCLNERFQASELTNTRWPGCVGGCGCGEGKGAGTSIHHHREEEGGIESLFY